MIRLFGFSILRNGIKYDYPFKESLLSLGNIVEEIYLALGKSDDGTEKVVLNIPKIKIIPTFWDDNFRKEGLILSIETNKALSELRRDLKEGNGNLKNLDDVWAFYLQGDEVILESEIEKIREDVKLAQIGGYDSISFRYLHFWKNHRQIAINKKWYPHEIRAFKLRSPILSWGDAQSFNGVEKIYYSDAHIFHYGHVREPESYKKKKKDILKFYHLDEKLPKYQKRERNYDKKTEVIPYFGPHPLLMKERINRLDLDQKIKPSDRAYLVISESELGKLPANFLGRIGVENLKLVGSLKDVPRAERSRAILLRPSWFQTLLYPSRVPNSMRSKLAQPWPLEMYLTLKLSEKGIPVLGDC